MRTTTRVSPARTRLSRRASSTLLCEHQKSPSNDHLWTKERRLRSLAWIPAVAQNGCAWTTWRHLTLVLLATPRVVSPAATANGPRAGSPPIPMPRRSFGGRERACHELNQRGEMERLAYEGPVSVEVRPDIRLGNGARHD